jgi:hypothetical protein
MVGLAAQGTHELLASIGFLLVGVLTGLLAIHSNWEGAIWPVFYRQCSDAAAVRKIEQFWGAVGEIAMAQ